MRPGEQLAGPGEGRRQDGRGSVLVLFSPHVWDGLSQNHCAEVLAHAAPDRLLVGSPFAAIVYSATRRVRFGSPASRSAPRHSRTCSPVTEEQATRRRGTEGTSSGLVCGSNKPDDGVNLGQRGCSSGRLALRSGRLRLCCSLGCLAAPTPRPRAHAEPSRFDSAKQTVAMGLRPSALVRRSRRTAPDRTERSARR